MKWQVLILISSPPEYPFVSYPVTRKGNIHANQETHKDHEFRAQNLVALEKLGKAARLNLVYKPVSIVTVKILTEGFKMAEE